MLDIDDRERDVQFDRVDQLVNSIVRRLEQLGENEIKSTEIGTFVMEALLQLDKVAYIRYASVYKNFEEPKDFEDFVNKLTGKKRK